MELRTNVEVPEPIPQTPITSSEISEKQEISTPPISTDKRSIDIDFSMKISKRSELIELLKIFQNQINTIKTTIDRLIEKTIDSDEESFELENSEVRQKIVKNSEQNDESSTSATRENSEDDFDELSIQEEPTLTALPPKPESLKKDEIDTEQSLKPAPKLKTKAKSKRELKNEKKGLETKLTSVQDLLEFIDKKHTSGNLNDNEFTKRSKKLQNDLKKTKKRIGIINKLLEK